MERARSDNERSGESVDPQPGSESEVLLKFFYGASSFVPPGTADARRCIVVSESMARNAALRHPAVWGGPDSGPAGLDISLAQPMFTMRVSSRDDVSKVQPGAIAMAPPGIDRR